MKRESKIPDQKVSIDGANIRYAAIENQLHLQFPLRFEFRGRTVGAFVLSKGKGQSYKFVFGFHCKGVHSTLKENQRSTTFDAIESGLKDLPYGETMTVHMGSFSTDTDRQQQLSTLFEEADAPSLKFLVRGEKERIRELTQQGVRKPKFLKIYVTYTVDSETIGATDQVDKLMYMTMNWWNQFTGQQEEVEQQRFEDLFTKAFTDGFQLWEQIFSTKMGLTISPMTEAELWEATWNRFNKSHVPPLPQRVTMSDRGLTEEIHSEIHPTSLIVERKRDCPFAGREWVKVRDRFVGAMVFEEKPAGWPSKFDELRYLWDILSKDRIYDTEVFCELSKANEGLVKTNMERLTKQSIVSADFAASRQSVDVAAEIKTKKTIDAQAQLYEGAVPLHTATVFLVHRNHPQQLDEACRYLQSCVRRPARLDRETQYAWLVWLQTLPITWDSLLVRPFNRRITYFSGEAPGFMSLVCPRECDRSGFELLTEEGGVPLFLDLFGQHRNLGVFATTRAGKSVLVSGILTQALAQRMPIVALDFPKPDGTSTFTDYTAFMGKDGAYFDIGSESNNLFELPNLRSLPLKEQQERFEDYKSFLEGALMTMIIGGTAESQMFRNTVRSLVVILVDQFFKDAEIGDRYERAIAGGFGSPAWDEMPTLQDFLPFCELHRLELTEVSDETVKAMGQIKLQLKFWITSRVGKAISAPSSFPTDARLLVFALRNLNDDADAAVLALSAYSAALRRALASPRSIFFIDESPILFQFDEISALVARLCANGAKAGVRVILSGQDPDTIAKSPSASKILQNLSTRLVGRIQPTAINSFVKYLDYPEEIISRNATESFFPKRESIYSQWLLDDSGVYTYCRFYPSYLQLAAVANNTDEQAARDAYMALYPGDRFKGLAEFATEMVAALRDGRPIRLPDGQVGGQVMPSSQELSRVLAMTG